jgi:hypothetical protein
VQLRRNDLLTTSNLSVVNKDETLSFIYFTPGGDASISATPKAIGHLFMVPLSRPRLDEAIMASSRRPSTFF